VSKIKFLKQVQLGVSSLFDKFEVATESMGTPLLTLYDSLSMYKVNKDLSLQRQGAASVEKLSKPASEDEESQQSAALAFKLEALQRHLEQKLEMAQNLYKEFLDSNLSQSQAFNRVQEEIHQDCLKIEQMQIYLFNLSEAGLAPEKQGDSLDYLYTLAQEFTGILSSSFENISRQALKSLNVREVFLNIFDTFIVFEDGPISNSMLKFLAENMMDALNEQEWELLVFAIIRKYLCKPTNVIDFPLNQIFSHLKIINSLDKISIPLGEVLSYLVIKLKAPLEQIHQIPKL